MKFHQLPDGARFEFEGDIYTKSGTLKACDERSGHLRVIRRSATVKLLESVKVVAPSEEKSEIRTATVRTAFETFCGVCDECLIEAAATHSNAEGLSAIRAKLEVAKKQFLATLS